MKVFLAYLLAFSCLILTDCSTETETSSEIIEINITEALNKRKDFPLSELVKDVEILELESTMECFMSKPRIDHFGKKFILVCDDESKQFFLFNREGEFVRKIGQKGKGPGEYYGFRVFGAMNPSESKIVVTNNRASRAVIFNILGEVVSQKDLTDHIPSKMIEGIKIPFDNTIAILPRRPYKPMDNYSSVVLFDMNLNMVSQVLPRPNDKDLTYTHLFHTNLTSNNEGAYFWETFKDTVYQYHKDGSSTPRYRFIIETHGFTKEYLRDNSQSMGSKALDYTFVMAITFLPGYLVAHVADLDLIHVFYNLKTGEIFSVGRETACDIYDSSWKWIRSSMENDIYGIEPADYYHYIPDQNICASRFNWDITKSRDLNCIRQLNVSRPDIRDQLLEICENPSDDQGLVLVLMEMR